jgi:hypothetical protein
MTRRTPLGRAALAAASVAYLACGAGLEIVSRYATAVDVLSAVLRTAWVAPAFALLAASWICMGLACGAAALRQRPGRPRRVAHRRREPVAA